MNTWLYLTAEGLNSPSIDWPCCVGGSTADCQSMPLKQAAQALQGQAIDLLLPMEMCSWVRTDPWPTKRKPKAQAIAFAVEDQLSEALEMMHLSVGPRNRDGCYPVLVIGRERLAGLLALLAEAAIEVRGVFVDADLLPGEQPLGVWWFGRWLIGGALPMRMALSQDHRAQLTPLLPKDMQWLDDPQGHDSLAQWMHSRPAQAINLLHGVFAPRRQRLPWRMGGMAVLMVALLSWGALETRINFLASETQRLTLQNEQRFKALYPDQSRIVDLGAQLKVLQNQPAAVQGTRVAGLVNLIERVIGASHVEVQRIEFREGDGWKIQLTANTFAELEQLRERGRQQGLPVRLDSANKAADRVHATLTMENEA
jgi:general secretion pathway protein L